jgi:hypothetical protein
MKILRTRVLGFAWTLMLVAVLAPAASAQAWWPFYGAEMAGSQGSGCAAPAPAAGPAIEGERAAAG